MPVSTILLLGRPLATDCTTIWNMKAVAIDYIYPKQSRKAANSKYDI